MCEQTEVKYLEGDVVWVKLGPCWWPGEVQDFEKMPPDIVGGFKKPPLAVVKFFQEDAYEYVKNLNNIYKYNCRKKNEFIKKGLDMYRNKNSFMEKFPTDVCKAETLTGGDPNILNSDMFAPEQKPAYSQIFGTPSPKKTPKFIGRGRPSTSTPRTAPRSGDKRIIHPRFIGKSDYEVTMLEQTTPSPKTSHYTCHYCGFESTRLNVIVLHNKSHSSGYISPSKPKPKVKSTKKSRKAAKSAFAHTTTIDEDIQLIRQGLMVSATDSSDSDSEDNDKSKSSVKRKNNKSKSISNASKKAKTATSSAICSNLLADWGDSENESETEKPQEDADKSVIDTKDKDVTDDTDKIIMITDEVNDKDKSDEKEKTPAPSTIHNELLADWDAHSDEEMNENKVTEDKTPSKDKPKPDTNENGNVSCFDFEEEEEQTVLEKSPGRKIPRVIPQKRKSSDISEIDRLTESDAEIKNSDVKSNSAIKEPETPQEDVEVDDSAFKSILEETVVPELPTIDNLKSSQNFQERKPIKSPDKKQEDSAEKTNGVFKHRAESSGPETVDAFHMTPKKRFVRNFEDFEMFHNEQKIAEECSTKQGTSLEVSKLKTQLMTKLTTEFPQNEEKSLVREAEVEAEETPVPEPEQETPAENILEEIPTLESIDKPEDMEDECIELNDPIPDLVEQPIIVQSYEDDEMPKLSIEKPTFEEQYAESPASEPIEETLPEKNEKIEEQHKEISSEILETPTEESRGHFEDPEVLPEEKHEKFVESQTVRVESPVVDQEMQVVHEDKPDQSMFQIDQHIEHEEPNLIQEQHIRHESHLMLEKPPLVQEELHVIHEEPQEEHQLIHEEHHLVHEEPDLVPHEEPHLVHDEPHSVHKEPTLLHEEPSFEHEEPSSVHEEPNLVCEEPNLIHEESPLVHEEPNLIQEEVQLMQEEPHLVHEEQHLVPEEPHLVREEPHIDDEDPHMIHEDPHMVHEEPQMVHEEPHLVHEEPHLVHEEPNLDYEEPHLVHEDPHLVHEEPHLVQDEHVTHEEPHLEPEESHEVQERMLSAHEEQEEPHSIHEEPQMIQEESNLDHVPHLLQEELVHGETPLAEEKHVTQEEPEIQEEPQIREEPIIQEPEHHQEFHETQVELSDQPVVSEPQEMQADSSVEQNAPSDEMKSKMVMDISEICIDNTDHLSGLTTLAAVSELSENFVFETNQLSKESEGMDSHQVQGSEVITEKVVEKEEFSHEMGVIEEQAVVDEETVERPIEQTMVEEPTVQTMVEQPIEQTRDEVPIEQTMIEQTMIEQTIDETIVEQPIEQTVVEQTIVEDHPIEEQAIETQIVEEQPMEEHLVEQTVIEEQSVIEEQTIVEEAPIMEEQVIETSTIEESTVVEEIPVEETIRVEDIPLPPTPKKVQTLANFSMDFSDSNESFPMKKEEIPQDQVSTIASDVKIDTEPQNVQSEFTISTSNNFTETEVLTENVRDISHDNIHGFTDLPPLSFIDDGNTVTNEEEYIEKMEQTIETTESLESEMAKLTDTHPGTEEVVQEQTQNTSSSKLLEILTEPKAGTPKKFIGIPKTVISSNSNKLNMVATGDKCLLRKFDSKTSKFVIKSATTKSLGKSNKPIILSEKIIKPVTESECVSVKKVTSKRTYQDVEDIDTFIIQKPAKKSNQSSDNDMQDIILTPKSEATRQLKGASRARGKPKIIEQTIIKAADVPASAETGPLLDDSMFDINSMPIVLSDQILTPESIENMPVVMSDLIPVSVNSPTTSIPEKQTVAPLKRGGTLQQVKLLNKSKINTSQPETSPKVQTVVKNIMPRGLGKNQKVYHSTSTKLLKNNPAVITQPGKPGKFIILPTSTASSSSGSKYTVGKRLAVKSTTTIGAASPTTSKVKAIQGLPNEPTRNKIMIVSNNQGVQSRVLLTPAQQKMFANKMPGTKITKGQTSQQVKGNLIHPKSILTSKGTLLTPINSGLVSSQKSPSLVTQAIMTSKGQIFTSQGQALVTSEGQVLTPLTPQQLRSMKSEAKGGRKLQSPGSRLILPEKILDNTPKGKLVMGGKTKTILIKGPQGQTIKKFTSGTQESKNIYLSGQKQLLSLSGQQLHQAGVSGKQVLVTSKGQVIKSDKINIGKQISERVNIQRMTKTPTRIQKTKTQMLLSPVTTSSMVKQSLSSTISVPPLTPITASQIRKSENLLQISNEQSQVKLPTVIKESKEKVEGTPLEQKHLIIQDAMGNQTTVTEGQILALPSEAIDGQPQSYMLVTVDECGNLAPISNETLMSLDPSLALGGGDMSNIVLQFDQQQGAATAETQQTENKIESMQTELTEHGLGGDVVASEQQVVSIDGQQIVLDQTPHIGTEQQIVMSDGQQMFVTGKDESYVDETQIVAPEATSDTQTVACNISTGETSQQLIITGDPESTQKFLASLSEGNTDLSSLLTGAEGNIIINTDGQQILLNTDADNQILLMPTSTEEDMSQSAMYVTQQAMKNQDILAAALADTDVFQQDATSDKLSVSQELAKVSNPVQSQLSPSSSLYPMNVGNVLETSLTLGSPIMSPLEVPSVGNKKIKIKPDLQRSLLTQVPSSLELPITITDPSISQKVSQQVLLGNDLQANLDLPISIGDTGMTSICSTEMTSPSFVYSLPTLEDHSDMDPKTSFSDSSPSTVITTESIYNTSLTGSMSMPLLTEEPEMPVTTEPEEVTVPTSEAVPDTVITKAESEPQPTTSFPIANEEEQHESVAEMTQKITNELEIGPIEDELDLQTSDICDSLSEPPPGMFDKSSFSLSDTYLSGKEPEDPSDIPLPPEPPLPPAPDSSEEVDCLPALTEETETSNTETSTPEAVATDVATENIESTNIEMDYETSEQPNLSEVSVNQDLPPSVLSNSEVNSPRLDIDETSCEIPVQPAIVTNLTESSLPTGFVLEEESRKRESEAEDESSDSKRTKLSCD